MALNGMVNSVLLFKNAMEELDGFKAHGHANATHRLFGTEDTAWLILAKVDSFGMLKKENVFVHQVFNLSTKFVDILANTVSLQKHGIRQPLNVFVPLVSGTMGTIVSLFLFVREIKLETQTQINVFVQQV